MDEDSVKVVGAFLVGGLVGAAIALLYAPQSGRQTRKGITKATKRVKREATELVEDTIDGINEFIDDTKDKVSDIIERGIELSDGAKKEIVKTLEHTQKVMEKQKSRIMEGLGL